MDNFLKFNNKISQAKKILITTHIIPDADGIGSEIALSLALNKLGKDVICVNEEPLLDRYSYLDREKVVRGFSDFNQQEFHPDLIIVVDTNYIARTGKHISDYANENNIKILYIDHHPCKTEISDEHCIDDSKAATGQLVGEFIQKLNIEFDKPMALALYTAILIDTSSFRYPTVSASTHKLVGTLLDTGISPPEAYNHIYGTRNIRQLHLLGEILASSDYSAEGRIAWITLTNDMLNRHSVDFEDTHAFINHLLILENVDIACMFRQEDKVLKLSMRSSGNFDVGKVARQLGGGGHSHSAATILSANDSIEETISSVIKKIIEIKNQ